MSENSPMSARMPIHLAPESLTPDDQHLLAYVRDRDVSCPLCGYNLRGLTIPRCPECGEALKLSVGVVEPFLKAWITCAAATCLSAGFGVFIVGILAMGRGMPDTRSLLHGISFFSFVAMIPVAAVVLWKRQWFLRRKREIQNLLAVVTVVAVIVQFGYVLTWLR